MIITQTTGAYKPEFIKSLTANDIIELQDIVRRVPAADHVVEFAVKLARATRPQDSLSSSYIKQFVNWGAGPRGAQALILGAKARAVLEGRTTVAEDDVRAIATPVLRHRVLVNFNAEAEGLNSEKIIGRLLEEIK